MISLLWAGENLVAVILAVAAVVTLVFLVLELRH